MGFLRKGLGSRTMIPRQLLHSYVGIGRSQLPYWPAVSQMETDGFPAALTRGGELNRNAARRTRAITAGVSVERFFGFLSARHRQCVLHARNLCFYACNYN